MKKFLHLADLHLGKRLCEYSLLDDQSAVLRQAVDTAIAAHCDGVLIAGDIYDKPNPAAEAMTCFNAFLTALTAAGIAVYMISGNHDSAARIAYYGDLIAPCGIYTARPCDGTLQSIDVDDTITIHLLPFVRPTAVRPFFPDQKLTTYEDAVRAVLDASPLDTRRVNVLLCHQYIAGATCCDSEELAIGGLDSISASVFEAFDYVALGHLHQPQRCTRDTVRYAGSLCKYSLSEEVQRKSFTLVTIGGKGDIALETVPIALPHDVRTCRGSLDALLNTPYTEDYIRAVVTDELVPPDARITLRSVFPNLLKFSVENSKTCIETDAPPLETMENKNPLELLVDFYTLRNNGVAPTDAQQRIASEIFTQLTDEEAEA